MPKEPTSVGIMFENVVTIGDLVRALDATAATLRDKGPDALDKDFSLGHIGVKIRVKG